MSGALHKTMVYLGLKDEGERFDDEYYDDEYSQDGYAPADPEGVEEEPPAPVTPLRGNTSNVRLVQNRDLGAIRRITTIHPRTYNEARIIGESFRDGTPVIMNLTEMDDADAKRLVDFGAGLVFGLRGSIERVTAKVFLLSPHGIEVGSGEQSGTPARTSPFNQS
ncbi:MAG TPA: cell division protein SepF [Intrasporangiaceae bacterium]|nr:cell division protein SepF [Intrasporangiaceae bacterium]